MSLARHMGGWSVTRQRLGSSVGTAKAEGDGNENRGSSGPDATLSSAVALRPGARAMSNNVGSEWSSAPPKQPPPGSSPHSPVPGCPALGLASALPLLTPAGLLDRALLALAPGL